MSLEELREVFLKIEAERFTIINGYIMGVLKKSEIDRFEKALFGFREKLYEFSWNEDNMMEIAKMKSKVQHFNTEILEDEEVLKVAYSNEN
mgnify:CR=1 FL=1